MGSKTVLVTGAAGFIGWKVCEFLLADRYRVIGADNLNDTYDVRMKEWRLGQLRGKDGFGFHRLDMCHRESLRDVFELKIDAIINLAGRAGVRQSLEHPYAYFQSNVIGTLNLLEFCREFGVGKFVLASTSSLYGLHNPQPFREDADTSRPPSPYAGSKKSAEVLCYTYHYLFGLDVTVLRYFTVYGPAGRPDMSLFRFVQWIRESCPVTIYGDGTQSRDFTYVDDIARGTLAVLKRVTRENADERLFQSSQGSRFEIINLGSDHPVVLMDAIRLVEALVGRKAKIEYKPRHAADLLATWADIGKAERLLKWRPETQFEDGLLQSVKWYEDNRQWTRDIITR